MNNVACAHRTKREYTAALETLQLVASIEETQPPHVDNATTSLNLGSVYSKLGK